MDTFNWLTLLGAVASAGVTYGVLSNQVGNLSTDLKSLREEWNRSRERTGERIEALVKDVAKLQERSRHRVVTSQGLPVAKESK